MGPTPEMASMLAALIVIATAPMSGDQRPASSPSPGKRIVAQDGDVIVVENDTSVGLVHRREVTLRALFNAEERWLVLLVDDASSKRPADGRVDSVYSYRDVTGGWPFGARWEGSATIDEYSTVGQGGQGGLGIVTPDGLVQLFTVHQAFRDPNAVAVLQYRGSGRSGTRDLGFDAAEPLAVEQVRRSGGVMTGPLGSGVSASVRIGAGATGDGPRPPMKIFDVRPVFPEMAARTNVRGIVVLEITIDLDGTVKDARVLRSIPLLDGAALDAVRQWRYVPTIIDGKPVPVTMTVTVAFESTP